MNEQEVITLYDLIKWVQDWMHTCGINHVNPKDVPFYTVCFAHRPDPKGWDGKSFTTGKIEHYQAETYGKGGWNIYGVKWWLDVELPKIEEEEK